MPREAKVGPEIHARVMAMLAGGEAKGKSEAFAKVAGERGMNPGTVSANFYLVERKASSSVAGRRRGRAATPAASMPDTTLAEIPAVAAAPRRTRRTVAARKRAARRPAVAARNGNSPAASQAALAGQIEQRARQIAALQAEQARDIKALTSTIS